jgi:hypothetical protein
MKGSNRHHFGVPPGLAPTHIIQHLTAKVNIGMRLPHPFSFAENNRF